MKDPLPPNPAYVGSCNGPCRYPTSSSRHHLDPDRPTAGRRGKLLFYPGGALAARIQKALHLPAESARIVCFGGTRQDNKAVSARNSVLHSIRRPRVQNMTDSRVENLMPSSLHRTNSVPTPSSGFRLSTSHPATLGREPKTML